MGAEPGIAPNLDAVGAVHRLKRFRIGHKGYAGRLFVFQHPSVLSEELEDVAVDFPGVRPDADAGDARV